MKRIYPLYFLLETLLCLSLFSCGQKAEKPMVGITCARTSAGADRLAPSYTEAIRKAGGIPVILPTLSTDQEADALLERLDGIVFSGGEDVHPSWYGEEILNETVAIDSVRDHSDSLLARAVLRSGKPVLAICRGEQLMNVILGGSLYQDIPTQLPEAHVHRGVYHPIGLVEGGFLEQLYGKDSLRVNSRHHQAVKDPAPGITVAAWSDDGIVEAWENPQIWAVQFHPESMVEEDDSWLRLFKAYLMRL